MNSAILKADSIEIDFDGRKILQGICLHCVQGEVLGLLGRNGCGKSTLLKIIFGSVTPGHKYVSIDGVVINKGYLNNHIAYLPQHHYLPTANKISELARRMVDANVWDEFAAFKVYQESFNKTVTQLSGGEWRQLEMLMILYTKARFVLLDEPFTHINPIQVDEFKTVIRQRAKTKGIIITDHYYRNVLEVSDRLILLHNGYTQQINSVDDLVTYGYISTSI